IDRSTMVSLASLQRYLSQYNKNNVLLAMGDFTFIDLYRLLCVSLCDNFAVIYSHSGWLPPFYH
ncbi:hypothetical protein, partial [Yersinia aleksiciae]|uniref:hypothetical protein n=1 Tax=Yersinia aleksiciae TaxID=263819 RepID=UPI001C95F3D7